MDYLYLNILVIIGTSQGVNARSLYVWTHKEISIQK